MLKDFYIARTYDFDKNSGIDILSEPKVFLRQEDNKGIEQYWNIETNEYYQIKDGETIGNNKMAVEYGVYPLSVYFKYAKVSDETKKLFYLLVRQYDKIRRLNAKKEKTNTKIAFAETAFSDTNNKIKSIGGLR